MHKLVSLENMLGYFKVSPFFVLIVLYCGSGSYVGRNNGLCLILVLNAAARAVNYRSLGAQPMSDWTVQRVSGEALRALAGSTGA